MALYIIILFVLLLLSALYSASETALFSISRTRARHLAKDGDRANLMIYRLKQDPHRLLSTILIGNNLVNIAASALATMLAIRLLSSYALGVATGGMTMLVLVFGEVLPKSLATRNNVMVARGTIFFIRWSMAIFAPLIWLLNFIPKLTGRIQHSPTATEEELMTFVEVVEEEGEIKEEEKKLIHNIFDFDDTKASEIMTPRRDMFVIDLEQPLDLKAIAEMGFTRIPVIQEDIDHIVGIVLIKDLFMHQTRSAEPPDIRKIMRPPYFIPENKKLDKLLQQFRRSKNHLAIVIDEHGGVSGLITLEDALEQLVGEIRDETDQEEPHLQRIQPGEWVVLGKASIEEVNEVLGMELPESGEYDTFSGYVLDRLGRIPNEKETLEIDQYSIFVKEKDGNRINRYVIRLPKPLDSPPATEN
ncbi:hemolysin family protein [Myxococcota bacterium]|nr:hemolysin family protein [Myxococcota bacterium]MBU1411092.1 hemolysin family protein [Myxococcota bacterium]MBU1511742.1 hemolysin family protein [Myxococcota bacterium]